MIGTHNPKLFNARLKQSGIRARLLNVPTSLVSSATVKLRRELWAFPRNAADMPAERAQVSEITGEAWQQIIPDIESPEVKQLLVPGANWRAGEYNCVSPVPHAGMLHELQERTFEMKLPCRSFAVQPSFTAWANHGESLLLSKGKVWFLPRGVTKKAICDAAVDYPVVAMTARAERFNSAAGFMARGWPAITAIGGFVHAIERKAGCDLQFAFGMTSTQPIARSRHTRLLHGAVVPSYGSDEVSSNGQIALLLRAEDPRQLNNVAKVLSTMTRFAGGSMFDIRIETMQANEPLPKASWLADVRTVGDGEKDALDVALAAYARTGQWVDDVWRQPRRRYSLSQVGFGFLNAPNNQLHARDDYPHAWAEPLFGLVRQGKLVQKSWWRRVSMPTFVSWSC